MSKQKFAELDKDGRVWWGKDRNNVPRLKRFLTDVKAGLVPLTLWEHTEVGHTQEAKKELVEIIAFADSESVFITPKPTRLIERIIQIATNPGDLVMDTFAGSGSTGHAVLKHNAARPDVAARRFILVEMEAKIARDVAAERVRRVAGGYTNAKGEKVAGLGGGFRYAELGDELFDEAGLLIRLTVKFTELARHVYFTETGEPLPRERVPNTPLLGVCRGTAVYLLYNGILKDKSPDGGNVLTRATLAHLPSHSGPKVVYCAGCRLGAERLRAARITVRQTPQEIKIS